MPFWQKFRESNDLLKKLQIIDLTKFFFSDDESKFFIFPHCAQSAMTTHHPRTEYPASTGVPRTPIS